MSSASSKSDDKNADHNFSKATDESSKEPPKNLTKHSLRVRKRAAEQKTWCEEFIAKKPSKAKSTLGTWNLVEKKSLLEGLKSYGPQKIKLIANLIGSKSEAEVQEKIFSLRGNAVCDTQSADGVTTEVRAPIEKWIHNVEELVNGCDRDCSQEISKALSYIAKHEDFNDNGVPDLSWRNIYNYLSALGENMTVGLPILSDIESMIILELMTDLGKTLNKLNIGPQRQILEHKIQLINAGLGVQFSNHAQRSQCSKLLVCALGNDFTGLEDILIGSSSASKFSGAHSSTETSSEISASVETDTRASSTSVLDSLDPTTLVPRDEIDQSKHIVLKNTEVLAKTFIKPKLFSLNPLCIPTKLLNFQPKKV